LKKDMANDRNNNRSEPTDRDLTGNRLESHSSAPNDLPDNPGDAERLRPEKTTIDLPDVKDIPGQEFVHVPRMEEMRDTTISSDDEEGAGIFEEEEDDTELTSGRPTVGHDERQALEQVDYLPTTDEDNLQRARMDNTDFQNEQLNEGSFGEERSGSDLDIPGALDETTTDALGQGDEENKGYSLGSSDNDNVTEGTP
jgi:hypothetical protein